MTISLLREWFQTPAMLWLLVPAFALVVVDAIRRWGTARLPRRIFGAGVRFAMLTALVVALADPRWNERDDVAHVVFVIDRSASIPDDVLQAAIANAKRMRDELAEDVKVGLVLFDQRPVVATVPGGPWTIPTPLRPSAADATDIDAALALALGLIPADDAGELVLFSDGRPTARGRSAAVVQAQERGIRIHTVATAPESNDPAVTAIVLAAADARPGSAIDGHVEVAGASEASRGTLTIKAGDTIVATRAVELEAGKTLRVPFSHPLDARTDPGPLELTATLTPNRADPHPENNTAGTTVIVGEPPLVRIFAGEDHDGASLARALRAERMDVQVVNVEAIKPQHEDLSDVDLVILSNAPAASIGGGQALQPAFLENLARFVDNGGGLIVLGGPQAYDMGGYGQSKLARVLPVKLDPVDPEIQAGATIIIILDRSGSMSAPVIGERKSKMELADEGAAASINLLRPFDRVGVMSVTEEVRWEIPTQSVRDTAALKRKVLKIRADGGGIFVYTGLEAAYAALDRVDTPLKHVILFSDAADSEEKTKGSPFGPGPGPTSQEFARKMRGKGVTTSVIGIGSSDDIDTPFLKDLANAGGGRFYLTADATQLRGLFVEETERLVDTSLHEIPFRPIPLRRHPIVEGVEYASAPPLGGYQELDARPTAEVILEGPEHHPILTTWRYGLGQVVAWASDAGPRWSEGWLAWPGYARQWTQASRFALRRHVGDETAIEVEFSGGQAQLHIARRDTKGLTIDDGAVRARISGGSPQAELSLSSLEPGLWRGEVPVEAGRSYTIEVLGDGDKVLATHTFAPPPSAELRHRSPDLEWLTMVSTSTNGEREPTGLDPATVQSVTTEVHQLWPWALLLALLLFPVDALLRRPARVL